MVPWYFDALGETLPRDYDSNPRNVNSHLTVIDDMIKLLGR